jgi:hypothetical protein
LSRMPLPLGYMSWYRVLGLRQTTPKGTVLQTVSPL